MKTLLAAFLLSGGLLLQSSSVEARRYLRTTVPAAAWRRTESVPHVKVWNKKKKKDTPQVLLVNSVKTDVSNCRLCQHAQSSATCGAVADRRGKDFCRFKRSQGTCEVGEAGLEDMGTGQVEIMIHGSCRRPQICSSVANRHLLNLKDHRPEFCNIFGKFSKTLGQGSKKKKRH